MFVIKRDGREEPVHFDKITARISKLAYGLNQEFCDPCVSRPTPRFKRFRAPRPARARPTAPLRAPHPARELVHESVAHPWTLRPRLTRPFRAPRPRADRFPVPARPLLDAQRARRPEGGRGRVQGRHHEGARRARRGDRRVHDLEASGLRAGAYAPPEPLAPRRETASPERPSQRFFLGGATSRAFALSNVARSHERPADVPPVAPLRSSPLASRSPTCTRRPRSPSRRRACPTPRHAPVSGRARATVSVVAKRSNRTDFESETRRPDPPPPLPRQNLQHEDHVRARQQAQRQVVSPLVGRRVRDHQGGA